jgi:hypothetical protein
MSGYPSGLTVGAFEMLLHYFYTPVDADGTLDRGHNNNRSVHELVKHGLARWHEIGSTSRPEGCICLTPKGEYLARYIMDTPMPKETWYIERSPDNG